MGKMQPFKKNRCNIEESLPYSSNSKESAWNPGDLGLITGSGRSSGEGNGYPLQDSWASLLAQLVENLSAIQETWVRSLGWEDPLGNLPFQRLENPMDRGACWATVHGVTELDALRD